MDTDDGSIEENTVKVFFDPSDTIYDVSARVKDMVQKNRKVETSGFAVKLASAVLKIPLLPNLVGGPGAASGPLRAASQGVSGRAALPHQHVHHQQRLHRPDARVSPHLQLRRYSMFISMGTPQRGYTVDAGGNVVRRCTLPIGVTVDERVCGGAVYAKLFAVMKTACRHPEQLETPPERCFTTRAANSTCPSPKTCLAPPVRRRTPSRHDFSAAFAFFGAKGRFALLLTLTHPRKTSNRYTYRLYRLIARCESLAVLRNILPSPGFPHGARGPASA